MIEAKEVVFTERNVVELKDMEFDPTPKDKDIVIRTIASIISAGTELSCLDGRGWAPFPFRPGYGAVGEVIAVGSGISDIKVGDIIFTHSNHASHGRAGVVAIKLPDGLDPFEAVFVRMADVSITALRVSEAELGDRVAVIGLGLVGNLAAQLFSLSGCDVIGIDRIEKRLRIAEECGIKKTIDADRANPVEAVMEMTEGYGCEVVVDATGNPKAAVMASRLARKNGEVILLGSFFGREYIADVTGLLERIHLWGHGCVSYKGAHEWRYPVREDKDGFYKHSIERNARINIGLIAEGKLKVGPLLTHRLHPGRCAEAYEGLRDRPDEFVGVVFDWG